MTDIAEGLTLLGARISEPRAQLETFPAPDNVTEVVLTTDEFTSLCPVTGQPDYCTIQITYQPYERCLESKSLKLYLWTFRERGMFTEALAAEIASTLHEALDPCSLSVVVKQRPRGGIALEATCTL